MSRAVHVVWDDALLGYDFGPHHPMSPVRLALTMRLVRAFGLTDRANVELVVPPVAMDEELQLVHSAAYIEAVRRAAADPSVQDLEHGLGTEDDPCFPAMHQASAQIAGGSLMGAQSVWEGQVDHAVNLAGGLHHAMRSNAAGFCIYNDPALAIAWLLQNGAERVAYVDIDVHHGDGVQAAFWDDPRVLTISLHETPRTLFPGTGWPWELGGPAAEGSSVNLALPPGTTDNGWLRAFDAVVPPLLAEFSPQVLVSQHGCDSHVEDPLAHLSLTVDGQRAAAQRLHQLAHRHCEGRWLATGGGGYAVIQVVPRTWTHLVAEAVGHPLLPETDVPDEWRDYVRTLTGRTAPRRMTDGRTPEVVPWSRGYDPADWLDQAVLATRKAVFPLHGIDHGW